MRCADCVWFDKEERECLRTGNKVIAPYRRRRCVYYNKVPKVALNYLLKMGEITELGEEVKNSTPFKNFLRKLREVRI